MRAIVTSYAAGLLFGTGIIISGMVDPANVLGFFDVFGDWNPTLAFVMAAGLAVSAMGYRLSIRSARPVCAPAYDIPRRTDIDSRLVIGSAIFGLGWGIAGYCPGPALIAAGGGVTEAMVFSLAMVAGMVAWRVAERAGKVAFSSAAS